MSCIQLRVWQWRCDKCRKKEEVVFSPYQPDLPEGWKINIWHDYTAQKAETLCGDCRGS